MIRMQINIMTLSLLTSTLFVSMTPAKDWKKEKTSDGRVSVEYSVTQIKNAKGEEAPLIEYHASMIDTVNFQQCVATLMDVSKHKEINDDKVSEKIKTLSEKEWIIYYALKIPWPLPKTDCVLKMNFSEDSTKNSAVFTFTAAPDQWPSKGTRRFSLYDVSYTLKNLGNGKVELSSIGRSSPPFTLPLWMISANFPNGAADPLRNIVKLAKSL